MPRRPSARYADPVIVNGLEMPIGDLAGRARALQQAFAGLSMHILDTVETPDRVVIAFLMRGRHAGPFVSPLGTVAPTHRDIEVRTIDVGMPCGQLARLPRSASRAANANINPNADDN